MSRTYSTSTRFISDLKLIFISYILNCYLAVKALGMEDAKMRLKENMLLLCTSNISFYRDSMVIILALKAFHLSHTEVIEVWTENLGSLSDSQP